MFSYLWVSFPLGTTNIISIANYVNLILFGISTYQCIDQFIYLDKFIKNKSCIYNLVNDIKFNIYGLYPLNQYSKIEIDKMKPVAYMERCYTLNTQNARDLDEILYYNGKLTDFIIHYKLNRNGRVFKEIELKRLNDNVEMLENFYDRYFEERVKENEGVNSISLKKIEEDIKYIKKSRVLLLKYFGLYKKKKPFLLIEPIGHFSPILFGIFSFGFLARSIYYLIN